MSASGGTSQAVVRTGLPGERESGRKFSISIGLPKDLHTPCIVLAQQKALGDQSSAILAEISGSPKARKEFLNATSRRASIRPRSSSEILLFCASMAWKSPIQALSNRSSSLESRAASLSRFLKKSKKPALESSVLISKRGGFIHRPSCMQISMDVRVSDGDPVLDLPMLLGKIHADRGKNTLGSIKSSAGISVDSNQP